MLNRIRQLKKRMRISTLFITLITISPAALFVTHHFSWDGIVFLAIYSGLSVWVVQILSADQQRK